VNYNGVYVVLLTTGGTCWLLSGVYAELEESGRTQEVMAMSALTGRITVAGVDPIGDEVSARRLAIGMSVSALAKRAGVDRGSLSKLEEGGVVRDTTEAAVLQALAEIEHEFGIDPTAKPERPGPHLIEFEVTGDFGVRVVVKGPVENAAELEASVARLIRDMKSDR
jgi:transcriptional regulator with XRE-family HTH domain